jgi:hypothetical protein
VCAGGALCGGGGVHVHPKESLDTNHVINCSQHGRCWQLRHCCVQPVCDTGSAPYVLAMGCVVCEGGG